MVHLERDLNDAFFASPSLQEHERKSYTPGDVDREKIYATWGCIFERQGKKLPTSAEDLLKLSDKYMDASIEQMAAGRLVKSYGLGYFAVLLSLRAGMLMGNTQHEKAQRYRARTLERMFGEEQLLPKVPTAN